VLAAAGTNTPDLTCAHCRQFAPPPDPATGSIRLRKLSLLEEAKRVAGAEGVALNQLINVAVAEKLSALRTEDYFRERSARANIGRAKRILKRAGRGNAPVAGDEV
jgi:hypothetical protein